MLPDEDGELPDTRTAFDLVRLHMEKARRDTDYKFVLAEVDYLKPHFDAFPQDRAELRQLLRDGRAELVGGTYNEPNTNLTGAETTIRNAVYGVGFQRDVLGADPRSAWMLDAFGFDPGFPGLMAQAGLTSSSWARGPFHQWGPGENTRMQFPAEFEWLSPDGNGLLTAYMANHYGAGWILQTTPDLEAAMGAAHEQFRMLAPVAATRNVMLPVGSDHVIPARWVTDVHREWNKRYVWPRFVTAIPREFFDAVRAAAAAPSSSVWITPQTRDMNPVYTGKDVSYADTKLAQRAGETAALEGERLATLAWLDGAPYPAESLDKAWRQLAYGAHHDAITGTESDQVYLDLLAGWREAWQRGDAARHDAIDFIARADVRADARADAPAEAEAGRTVTVFNGLARERDGMATVTVRLDEPGTPWLSVCAADGTVLEALAEGAAHHPDGTLARDHADVPRHRRARPRLPALPAASPRGRRRRLDRRRGHHDRERRLPGNRRPGQGRHARDHRQARRPGRAARARQRACAAGGVRQAPALGRGPVAPVAEGPRPRLGVQRRGRPDAVLPRRAAAGRHVHAGGPGDQAGNACSGTARTGWSSAPMSPDRSARTGCCASASPPTSPAGCRCTRRRRR